MIVTTERIRAEEHTNKIKNILQQSQLNFCLRETPYSVELKVRKKFLVDYSNPQCDSIPTSLDSSKVCVQVNDELFNLRKELEEKNLILKSCEEEIAEQAKQINDFKEKMKEKDTKMKNMEKEMKTESNTERALKILIEKEEKNGIEKDLEIKRL